MEDKEKDNVEDVKKEVENMIDKSVTEKTDAIKEDVKKSIDESKKTIDDLNAEISGLAKNADIDELKKKTESLETSMKEKTETIKKMGERLTEINKTTVNKTGTLKELIFNALVEKIGDNTLEDLKSTSDKQYLSIKAADTIFRANLQNGSGYLTEYERGVTNIQRATPFMRELVFGSTISMPYAEWVEELEGEGGADMTAEGDKKPNMDVKWETQRATVRKIAVITKITKETLADIHFAAEEIARSLTESVLMKEDRQILMGDGIGQNYKGVMAYAPTFTVSATENKSYYKSVANATRLDVLLTAIGIIQSHEFMPNTITVNPNDARLMDMVKDSTGNYIMSPFSTSKSVDLQGMTIKGFNGIPEGTFIVGDMTKSNYRIREDITLEFGLENDDFSRNLITILAELRGVHYIKNNHKNAFLQGKFSDAIEMISGNGAVQKVEVVNDITISA